MEVVTEIHPGDGMVNWEQPKSYFLFGESGLECIRKRIDSEPRSILDLPCGHGRVLRYLRAAYPEAEITACDINREGVDFCAETFGAVPLYSSDDPSEIETRRFDLIWCGSLLTHFDAPRWKDWLDFFEGHLEPGGSLVFTTHGRAYAAGLRPRFMPPNLPEMRAEYEQTGFSFNDHHNISLSSVAWVFGQLAHRQGNISLEERGWHNCQDVWCLKAP